MSKRPVKKTSARRTKAVSAPARQPEVPSIIKRTIDLGREEELVTWNEWMERASLVMKQAVPPEAHDRLAFRLTTGDRRQFIVRQVIAHVARGKCTIGPSRWNEREAICDVITGYMFVGMGEDAHPATMCIPATFIRSLECVLLPESDDEKPAPFGFYKRDDFNVPHERKEVEEVLAEVGAI
jgi:hypothetical protein